MTACDYSDARFTSTQLKDRGITAVGRYLTGAGKAISKAELDELIAGEIKVWFFFEDTTNDATGGAPAGVAHAQAANAALQALGLPTSQPVYFADDEDQLNPTSSVPYATGLASVRPTYTNGFYGEGAILALLYARGLIAYRCQSESTSFPGSTNPAAPGVNIQQSVTTPPLPTTDLDLILTPDDFGQYPRPVAPTPAPTPTSKEGTMLANVPTGGVITARPTGAVETFTGAAFHGSLIGHKLNAPIVGICSTETGKGYWLLGADGGVFCFGDAQWYGPTPKWCKNQWKIGEGTDHPFLGIVRSKAAGVDYALVSTDPKTKAPKVQNIPTDGQFKVWD